VNPVGSFKPVAEQAREWLGLVEDGEAGEFSRMPYRQQIRALHERASARGKQLVVRDWVTVNFLPGTLGERGQPSGELEQELYLSGAGLESLPLVVARRGLAVLRSIRHNFPHLANLPLEIFARAYASYALAVSKFPRVQVERLRAEPQPTVEEILGRFGLEQGASATLLARFHEFRNCTGNTRLQATSVSAAARRILPPEASGAHAGEADHPLIVEADRLLGYER
jgi:hypothetical protein